MNDALEPLPHAAFTRQHRFVLILAIAIFAAAFSGTLLRSIHACHNQFVYPLDDTYIHATMARNLALRGEWGVNPSQFASASSSLIWPILIAAIYSVFGVSVYTPMILATVFALACIAAISWICKRERISPKRTAILQIAVILLGPLAPLALSGMEHALQILVDLLFIYAGCRFIFPPDEQPDRTDHTLFLLCTPMVVLARFEGLFLVAAVTALLVYQRRWRTVAIVLTLAAAPIAIHAAVSLSRGGLWLPNSIILKRTPFSFDSVRSAVRAMGGRAVVQMATAPWVAGPFAFALALLLRRYRENPLARHRHWTILILLAVTLIHLQVAAKGNRVFFRYEAYLMILLAVFATLDLGSHKLLAVRTQPNGWRIVYSLCLVVALAGTAMAFWRAWQAWQLSPVACKNIHDQQIQMARFINAYYPHQTILTNDIGAIAFLTPATQLDMFGLADNAIARAKVQNQYTSQWLAAQCARQNVKVAIIYDDWIPKPAPPPTWKKVATLTTPNNFVCGYPTVSFYALRNEQMPILQNKIEEFQSSLPEDVSLRQSD